MVGKLENNSLLNLKTFSFLNFQIVVPSSPPEDLRCAGLSSTSLQVSWQPPPLSQQNGLLQGYKVSFETISDDYRSGECH